jgi:hypothetical protein
MRQKPDNYHFRPTAPGPDKYARPSEGRIFSAPYLSAPNRHQPLYAHRTNQAWHSTNAGSEAERLSPG